MPVGLINSLPDEARRRVPFCTSSSTDTIGTQRVTKKLARHPIQERHRHPERDARGGRERISVRAHLKQPIEFHEIWSEDKEEPGENIKMRE